MKGDCKLIENCQLMTPCWNDCPDYEQDPQIARDNDTMMIANKYTDFEKLFNLQSVIMINQSEEIHKLKYDHKIMIGLLKNSDRCVCGDENGK